MGRLGLLASAIAGRDLRVAPGSPGEPAWTDGRAVFVDAETSVRQQVGALVVQASLLGAGSLEPAIVRRLRRRPALVRRYLAVEGHRALAAIEDLLPRSLGSLVDRDVAARSDSPASSLTAALGRAAIADPPHLFGTIRPRPLLASLDRAQPSATTRRHLPTEQGDQVSVELGDEEDEGAAGIELFSVPGGGEGALGRWLARMLRPVRRLGKGGAPGADTPTRWRRAGRPGDGRFVVTTRTTGSVAEPFSEERGTRYPEWDLHQERYRRGWCTVHEVEAPSKGAEPFVASAGYGLRRPLARLGMGLDSCHRQAQGDDIDIDAAIEARVQAMAGSPRDDAVYLDSLRRRRDLAVLVLLDVSGSTGETSTTGRTVHEQQRRVAAALTLALHELGDRVALFAFHSQGRSAVHLVPIKRFDDDLDGLVMQRLGGLVPAAYSRLGAAIRHGAAVLKEKGGTSRRLLVVLSDGLAYDHGYEPAYGAADARRALAGARSEGVGCLCLSIGVSTDADALRQVFGSAAHAMLPRPEHLIRVIGPLFRAALRSAEVQRRVSR